MRSPLAAALLLTAGLAGPAAAEPVPTSAPVPLATLVAQLGDRNFRTREAAARALVDRGEAALPALRKAAEGADNPEARRRLQAIIAGLERDVALAPKRVTLKAKDRPVNEVVAALAQQTGYQMQVQGNAGALVSLDLNRASYWEAMDALGQQTGLVPHLNDGFQGRAQVLLYQQDLSYPWITNHGPFRVMANNFHYQRTVTLGGLSRTAGLIAPRSETLHFSFTIQSEPKLPIMQLHQAKVVEAVDDLGTSMVPATPVVQQTHYYYGSYRTHNQTGQVPLVWPNKDGRVVKRLRGSIPVTVLAYQRPEIIVDDVTKVKDKKFPGTSAEVHVHEVKNDPNNKTSWHIKLGVRSLAPNANQDYNWSNLVHQRVELFDAKGNKYFSQGMNWESGNPGALQATFMFGTNGDANIGAPARLVFNYWGTLQHQVDFDFRDVPLP